MGGIGVARDNYHQHAFWGGEWSPEAQGDTTSTRYKTAMQVALNGIPLEGGAFVRRSGTQFIGTARNNGLNVKMIPLLAADGTSYMLELTNGIIRFYSQGQPNTNLQAAIQSVTGANPAVWNAAAHGFSTGDRVVVDSTADDAEATRIVKLQQFILTSTGAGTFTLAYTGARSGNVDGADITWTSGTVSRIREIASPYGEDDVPDVMYTQDENYLYLFHGAVATRRISLTTLAISTLSYQDGPYLTENTTAVTLTPSAVSGTVTLTASSALFASTDVGRLIRIKDAASNWTWGEIASFSSTTSVTWTIRGPNLSSTAARTTWRLGVFSDTTGWPTCGTFHENRLALGSEVVIARVDLSATYLPDTYSPTSTDGTVPDNAGLTYLLTATGRNIVRWFVSLHDGLAVGTEAGEWLIRASSLDDPLTPTSVQARRHTRYGSAAVQAVEVHERLFSAQALNTRIVELHSENGRLKGRDASVQAHHIPASSVRELASSYVPYPVVWVLTDDGKLSGISLHDAEDGYTVDLGWHRQSINYPSDDEVTETGNLYSIAVAPRSDRDLLDADTLWMACDRAQVSCIELLRPLFTEASDETDTFFVDSGVRYSEDLLDNTWTYDPGNSEATFYGLYHLEGTTVDIVAFGADLGTGTVSDGAITVSIPTALGEVPTLLAAGGSITIGRNYVWRGQGLRPDPDTVSGGSALGKTRRVDQFAVFVNRTASLRVGVNFDEMVTQYFNNPAANGVRPLFTGVKHGTVKASYDFDNGLAFEQDRPGPGMVVSVNSFLTVNDR